MPNSKVLLLFAVLLVGCSSNAVVSTSSEKSLQLSSSLPTKLDISNFKNVGFVETRRLLAEHLSKENADDIQKLAIDLGLIKPMFVYRELDEKANFSLYYSYALELRCGNNAYKEALDNVYFRKALFSLFDHDNYLKTTHFHYLNSTDYDSSLYGTEPTDKISAELNQAPSLEGVDVAKRQYELALRKGLPEETIEVYVDDAKVENLRAEYLNQLFLNVFGESVRVVSKHFFCPYYYAIIGQERFSGANSFISEFNSRGANGFELLSRVLPISDDGYNDFEQYMYQIAD